MLSYPLQELTRSPHLQDSLITNCKSSKNKRRKLNRLNRPSDNALFPTKLNSTNHKPNKQCKHSSKINKLNLNHLTRLLNLITEPHDTNSHTHQIQLTTRLLQNTRCKHPHAIRSAPTLHANVNPLFTQQPAHHKLHPPIRPKQRAPHAFTYARTPGHCARIYK
jgi:hypothetical protein